MKRSLMWFALVWLALIVLVGSAFLTYVALYVVTH